MGLLKDIAKSSAGSLAGGFVSSFGSGLASGLTNQIFGETLEDKQKYALEQMEKQAELNERLYDKQFQDQLKVSDPSFIRQRLERAGLSPSLALQGGATSSGLNASIGAVSPAGGISSSLRGGASVNVLEAAARIRNLDADTESKKTDTDYNKQALQTRLDILSEEKLSKMYANSITRIDALYKEAVTKVTLDKLRTEIDAIAFDIANKKELTDIEKQKLRGYLDSLNHQYALWESQIGLNEAKTNTETFVQQHYGTLSSLNQANADEKQIDNAIRSVTGYKPGWNVWQMFGGILNKIGFSLAPDSPMKRKIDDMSKEDYKEIGDWFASLPERKQKEIIENFGKF